ncbi:MAG: PAS domain S-box protein [Chloroflexota bacterium]
MLTLLKRWFTAPVYAGNEEQTRRARFLNLITAANLLYLFLFIPVYWLDSHHQITILALNIAGFFAVLFMHYQLRQGRVSMVGILLLVLAFVWISVINISQGTILSPSTANYIFVVILAGLLFNWRGSLVAMTACSLSVWGLILAENAGLLPKPDYTVTILQWFTYTGLFVITGGLSFIANQYTQKLLVQTKIELIERKKNELELRKLTQAVEQSPASIVITDLQGKIEYVNPRFSQVTGYSLQEVIGKNPRILKSNKTAQTTYSQLWQAITSGKEWHGEFINRKKDGSQYIESASISPIIDPDGSITHYLAVNEDITERKQMENALRTSEERFRHMFEDHHAVMLLIDPETARILDANTSAQKFYGYPRAELTTMLITDLNTVPAIQVLDELQKAVNNELNFFYATHRLANGDPRSVEIHSSALMLNDKPVLFSIIHDVSERKRVDNALRTSEERFRHMFEDHHAVMLLVDPDSGQILDANTSAQNFYGYTRAALQNMSMTELNAVSANVVMANLQKAASNETNLFIGFHKLANGETRSVEIHSSPLILNDKPALFSIIHDITTRTQMEQALRKSEESYRLLAENISDVIWILDLNTCGFRYVSPSVERLRGYSPEEVLTQDMSQSISPNSLLILQESILVRSQAYQDGYRGFYVDEIEQPCKNGSTVWTETTTTFRTNESNGHLEVYGVSRNIRERKQAEEALRANMKHFQDLVEHLPVAYHSLDESGRLIDVNQDWCELLGYRREEVLGKAFIEFWAAENRQAFAERFEVFKQKGFSDNEQIVLCKKNGSQLTVLLTGRVQLNAAGAFDRTHSIMVDITESRQAQVAMQIANEKLILHMAEIEYLQTELREQALRDPLTGLFNRRYLNETIEREILRADREKTPLSVIIADIDFFKKINDLHGHQAGDKFLVEIASILKHNVRGSDIVCRYGGEEFLLVLPDTSQEAAASLAEKLRILCAGLVVPHDGKELQVSMSFGVATYPEHGTQADEVIMKADKAMYQSKTSGRNRVTNYVPDQPEV